MLSTFRAAVGGGQALPPWDDYWYQRPGFDSSSGMAVSPESAMRISAVYSCIRYRSEMLASRPLIIFRHLPNGGRERAPEHPLYDVLHSTPNQWQTSLEFVEMMQAHLDLRGNAFAHIVPGPRGAIDQLVPIHPDLVQVYRLPNGKLKYQVGSRFLAETNWYMQEEIFHLRGLSSDGLVGLSPIALERETFGNALAIDDYAGRFFLNGARPSGALEYPGKFKDDAARAKFGESWRQAHVAENAHKIAVLEDGMKYTAIGISNVDAEFINSKKLTREEIAGIYRVPGHKVGIMERSTNNNIEHQGIEAVTDCIEPIAIRWERRVHSDLIEPLDLGDGEEYFAQFIVDGLLRGDLGSRNKAYFIGRNGGWLSPNDIRNFENLNPIPAAQGGDDYLRPINYAVAGAPDPNAQPADNPAPDAPDDPATDADPKPAPQTAPQTAALLHAFATEAARRVVRKEVTALRKELARAGDHAAFAAWAASFYESHGALVAETLCITREAADKYVAENRELLLNCTEAADKSCVIDWIEDVAPGCLADLAVGPRGRVREKARIAG